MNAKVHCILKMYIPGGLVHYPTPKHGIDQLCIRRTPLSVLGTSGGPSWAQALVSTRMSLNTFPSPYAILKKLTRALLRLERTMNLLCH